MKLSNYSFLTIPILFMIGVLSISSCKKKSDDPQPTTPVKPIIVKPSTPAYYFDGSFGDTKISYKEGVNNFYSGMSSSSDGQYNEITEQYDYYFDEGGTWTKITKTAGQITPTYSDGLSVMYNKYIPNVDPYKFPTQKDLETIYPVGKSTLFLPYNSPKGTDGWQIGFQDKDGNYWRTDYTGADQSASFVKIDSRANEVINQSNVFTIKGSLSCKVYDESGNSKILSGSFYQIFSDYSSY